MLTMRRVIASSRVITRRHRVSVPDDRRATQAERRYVREVEILARIHERALIERLGHPAH